MSKFKKGDKVRTILPRAYNFRVGEVFIVESELNNKIRLKDFINNLVGEYSTMWPEECFELVEESTEFDLHKISGLFADKETCRPLDRPTHSQTAGALMTTENQTQLQCGACPGCEGVCRLKAENPPALGGEVPVLATTSRWFVSQWNAHSIGEDGWHVGVTGLSKETPEGIELVDRAHVTRLQAEVERLRAIERSYGLREGLLEQVKGERDRMIERVCELSPEVERLAARTAELEGLLRESAICLQFVGVRDEFIEFERVTSALKSIDTALNKTNTETAQ